MPVPRCSANWPNICRLIVAPGWPAAIATVASCARAWGAIGMSAIATAAVRILFMYFPLFPSALEGRDDPFRARPHLGGAPPGPVKRAAQRHALGPGGEP